MEHELPCDLCVKVESEPRGPVIVLMILYVFVISTCEWIKICPPVIEIVHPGPDFSPYIELVFDGLGLHLIQGVVDVVYVFL